MAIIANGGTHYRPYLVQKAVDSKGEVVHDTKPEVVRKVKISSGTLKKVREAMRLVNQPGGTGYYSFSRLPVSSAGKTGSAEVAVLSRGLLRTASTWAIRPTKAGNCRRRNHRVRRQRGYRCAGRRGNYGTLFYRKN